MVEFLNIAILLALARLLIVYQKPFLIAFIYSIIKTIFVILFSDEFDITAVLIGSVISYCLSAVYFWLLWRFEESIMIYWTIAILGIVIGLI